MVVGMPSVFDFFTCFWLKHEALWGGAIINDLGMLCRFIVAFVVGFGCPKWVVACRRSDDLVDVCICLLVKFWWW